MKPRFRIRSSRRGNALVLVVMLVAAVSVLGLSYIESNSTTVQGSFNLRNSSRARYLAESGVEQAMHWLSVSDPPGANADGYWPGASQQRIDDTSDYYDVTVTRDPANDRRYKIAATGFHVIGADNSLAHRVTAWVAVAGDPTVAIGQALHVEQFSMLAPNQTYKGNVHCNSGIISSAYISGDLTAASFATYTRPPDGQTRGFQDPIAFPGLAPSHYRSYRLGSQAYAAVDYNLENLSHTYVPLSNVTAANPGGVLRATHANDGDVSLRLRDNLDFTGTIIVDGDLRLDGQNIHLTAKPGFPAIVVTGDIIIAGRDTTATIAGAVIAGGRVLADGSVSGSQITINGPLHLGRGMNLGWFSGGGITVDHAGHPDRGWLYDFRVAPEDSTAGQVTVESWLDQ